MQQSKSDAEDARVVEVEQALHERRRSVPFTPEEVADLRERLKTVAPYLRRMIRNAREELGWSQARLASELSQIGMPLDPTAITRIESGQRSVRAEELWALAAVLREDVEGLLIVATDVMPASVRLEFELRKLHSIESSLRVQQHELSAQEALVADLRSRVAEGGRRQ